MAYVDFFCLPLSTGKEAEYKKMAEIYAAFMKSRGMLSYCEAVAEDVPHGKVTDFYRAVQAKDGETVVASFCVWPDKATRDKAWQDMMNSDEMKTGPMPFDGQRMFWGGFKPILEFNLTPDGK